MPADVATLLAWNEDQLLADLGASAGRGFGPSDLIRGGREIFDNCWSAVERVICTSEKLRALQKVSAGDGSEVASAIIDLIAGLLHGIPAATVAVLIVKRGLPHLCRTYWDEGPKP